MRPTDDLATVITLSGVDFVPDEVAALRRWLDGEIELRGRIRTRQQPPADGTLGTVPEALIVALGQGGAATVLASGLITWLRSRPGTLRCKVTLPDGSAVKLSAEKVRGLHAQQLVSEIARLTQMLQHSSEDRPADDGTEL